MTQSLKYQNHILIPACDEGTSHATHQLGKSCFKVNIHILIEKKRGDSICGPCIHTGLYYMMQTHVSMALNPQVLGLSMMKL